MLQPFIKQAQTSQQHIQTWLQRGLVITDQTRVERYLEFIGYYRFSAYTIPFQQPNVVQQTHQHQFKPNTTFDDILNLYLFDRELRLLVIDAIERIEVAIRTQICNTMCIHHNDAFWYVDEQHFDHNYEHKRLLSSIERQLLEEKKRLDRDEKSIDNRKSLSQPEKDALKDRARKENFLRHYLSKYSRPKLPPSWMMVEMLTWGELSHLYIGLESNSLKKQIAKNLGVHAEVLESWLKTLNDVRNICAHHSRLWNKEFGRSIKIPTSQTIQWLSTPVILSNQAIRFEKRLYLILVALQTLMYQINPKSGWAKRLHGLMNKYPNISKANMGMPELWHQDQFWYDALN